MDSLKKLISLISCIIHSLNTVEKIYSYKELNIYYKLNETNMEDAHVQVCVLAFICLMFRSTFGLLNIASRNKLYVTEWSAAFREVLFSVASPLELFVIL